MPATLCNGPIIQDSKPGERKLATIRQKAYQPFRSSTVALKQVECGKTKQQRPTLANVKNMTSRIPVCGEVNKAKIALNENDICTCTRRVAPEAVKATDHKEVGDANRGHSRYHLRQKTERVMVPKLPAADTIPADICDVDANDGDDPQLCQVYVRDICRHLLTLEQDACYTIKDGFLENQSEVQSWHRAVLIDWLIQVQRKFGMLQETLFICVDTIDRYIQVVDVAKNQLQLVGVTALLIAAKYEEVYPPSIRDFAYITADTYSTKQIREMERDILKRLSYRFNKPLPIHFLRRYSKVGDADTKEHNLTKYILELSSLDANTSAMLPSKRAAGAFLLAKSLLSKKTLQQLWTPTLAYYSQYKLSDLLEAKRKLHHALTVGHTSQKFRMSREKYSTATFMKVSTLPVLQDL